MPSVPLRRSTRAKSSTVLVSLLLVLSACSSLGKPPSEADIAGLSPSGYVTLTEAFVVALGGGSGTLQFQGRDDLLC